MQPREKILAGVLASAVGVWFALPVVNAWFLDPLQELESRELSLSDQLSELQSKRIALAKSDKELRDWKTQSLPPDTLTAERLYQEWLTELAELAGFRNLTVTKEQSITTAAGRGEARNQFTRVLMLIRATGTLAQLQQFTKRFQEVSLLHRINSCETKSSDNEGDPLLTLTIKVEGLALHDVEPRKRLFPETGLQAAITPQETKLQVADVTGFPKTAPFRVRLDREFMEVSAVQGTEWTIDRAQAGTYAADHAADATLQLVPLRAETPPTPLLSATSLFAKPSPPVIYSPKFALSPPPVIRGVAWTWKPTLSGWNPAEPDPVYKLETYPEGMTVDAATGVISWSPADTVEVGPYEAQLVALSGGNTRAQVTIPLKLRLPNNPPKIEPISQLTFYFGRESTARVNFSDADMPSQRLTFSLEGAPQGMVIDSTSGVIRWLPPDTLEPQSLSVTVKATDSDEMPLTDSINVPIKIEEDAAKYTRLVGITRFGKREAWLRNMATNEDTSAFIGDQVKVADIEFKVLDIQRDKVIVDRDGKPFRLDLGSFVVALTPAAADEVPTFPAVSTELPTAPPENAVPQEPAVPNPASSPEAPTDSTPNKPNDPNQ